MATRPADGARARSRRREKRCAAFACGFLAACVMATAAVPLVNAQTSCSAYLDMTSFFTRTTLQVDPRNEDDVIPLTNVLYSNSKTPITVRGGSRLSVTVRIEASGNATRNALAAAIVFDLPGGRHRRILTDTSWRWSPARSTSGTRAAHLHLVALTEEYYPTNAQWLTNEPDGRTADVYWSTFSKTLPRSVCAGVVPGPARIPGMVASRCAVTSDDTTRNISKWGVIASSVLGTLTLLSLAAAVAALVLLRRVQRRWPPSGGGDNGTDVRAAVKLASIQGGGGFADGDDSTGGRASDRSGGGKGSEGGTGGGGARGKGGEVPAPSSPPSPSFSSGGMGPPPVSLPPPRPMEQSQWPPVSSATTPTAPSWSAPLNHGPLLSDKETVAAAAAETMVVRRASVEHVAAGAPPRPGDFPNEVGSTISSAAPPPRGGYTAACASGFPPPPPMPISLLSPQSSATGLDFAASASRGR